MAAEMRLNQIVKGAPATTIKPSPSPPLTALGKSSENEKYSLDPHLSALPSSPPQIYLNLLILESSLRAQYSHLVSRRRLNTFFLLILAIWNAFFFYALFLRPREDGMGLGGSVYWVVETSEKLALMGGFITVLLVWGTGQWERGIRWPRKWLGTTNRGLRGFNLRVVLIRRKFWIEMLGHLSFLFPFGLWREAGGSDWHLVEHETGVVVEEDLAPGGDGIMLLLLPKFFSPEFRENWEEYRTEYWDKENDRRAVLRKRLAVQRRAKAKETGGWKWWTGAWRLASQRHHRRHHDLEKHPHLHQHGHGASSHRPSISDRDGATHTRAVVGTGGRRRTNLDNAESTHSRSRQSSRSSTPHIDIDGTSERPLSERVRRGSSVSSTASVRRKTKERAGSTHTREGGGFGSLTPLGTPLLSPLSSVNAVPEEDLERHRRRRRATRDGDASSGAGGGSGTVKRDKKSKTKDRKADAEAIESETAIDAGGESSVPTTPTLRADAFSLTDSSGSRRHSGPTAAPAATTTASGIGLGLKSEDD